MRKIALSLALFGGCCVACAQAQAQAQAQAPAPAPVPVPEAMPYNVPYGAPITLARAKHVVAAAEAEAMKHGWKLACAIVDPSGDLVYFERIDDTQYASIAISQNKARTAATFRRPTKVFQDAVNSGQAGPLSFPGMTASEGGLPLIEEGKLIGAIGCSGALAAQDGVAAKAGADTVK